MEQSLLFGKHKTYRQDIFLADSSPLFAKLYIIPDRIIKMDPIYHGIGKSGSRHQDWENLPPGLQTSFLRGVLSGVGCGFAAAVGQDAGKAKAASGGNPSHRQDENGLGAGLFQRTVQIFDELA